MISQDTADQPRGIALTPKSCGTEVRTMIGTKQTPLALRCLGSLKRYVKHDLVFAIHSDGTLTETDKEKLTGQLGSCQFFVNGDSFEVEDALAKHPNCMRFRRNNLFGIKLFDIPIQAGPRIVYCDTDVLCTRPLKCDPFFCGTAGPFIAMQDIAEQYSVKLRDWHWLSKYKLALPSRFCAGLMSFNKQAYDLDYIEWLLTLDRQTNFFSANPFWAEQTIYAQLAAKAGCSYVDPTECIIAHPTTMKRPRMPAIIHFAGFHRHFLDAVELKLDADDRRAPVDLVAVPARNCNLPRRLFSAISKRTYLSKC